MTCIIKAGEIFTETEIIKNGSVEIAGDIIHAVAHAQNQGAANELDLSRYKLLPGLVDIHVHGGNGADTMDLTEQAIETMAKFKLREGVTSFCPTTVTTSLEKTRKAIETVKRVMDNPPKDAAKILGSFLEGPYIDPRFKGAHPENYIREISIDELNELIDIGGGTVVSVAIAPDKDNAFDAIEYLKGRGINIRIGHSSAKLEQANTAVLKGASVAIHTFNAMSSFTHREPGMVGAVLSNEKLYGEIICDLVHVHPTAVKILIDAKTPDKVILITDCMMAGGLADGSYMLGELPVKVENSIARTMDGALAGSTLSMMQAVKNVSAHVGAELFDAVKMASITPARAIGVDNRIGSIAAGKKADLVAIDDEFNVIVVMVDGEIVYDRR